MYICIYIYVLDYYDTYIFKTSPRFALNHRFEKNKKQHRKPRSNWQPPWEEGSTEPGEPMSLERLRQEDESTVYDWVGSYGPLGPLGPLDRVAH